MQLSHTSPKGSDNIVNAHNVKSMWYQTHDRLCTGIACFSSNLNQLRNDKKLIESWPQNNILLLSIAKYNPATVCLSNALTRIESSLWVTGNLSYVQMIAFAQFTDDCIDHVKKSIINNYIITDDTSKSLTIDTQPCRLNYACVYVTRIGRWCAQKSSRNANELEIDDSRLFQKWWIAQMVIGFMSWKLI